MTGRRNRRESLAKTKPRFTEQEMRVLLQLNIGLTDAWTISNKTGMLITSVRRCLTDLVAKGEIIESGTVFNSDTQRNVTAYRKNKPEEVNAGGVGLF